uniref:Phosphorylase b kinase regulatory subunit n=1 Tax=Macrostomum lignano TaxID=282301 RepID=A0A1I8H7G0_9PLAT
MRSLLACMMRQSDKLEKFKQTRQPSDALHCKFSASNLGPVAGDNSYGHLQLDAVALFLLALAQMTASGLVLIYTAEEVAFVQNLVFYIDSAYTVCDYGIWERGDKTNHGLPELNSTSIGMAKAALEAMSELDLFGSCGGNQSSVHVLADDSQNCAAVLENMLPRESCSKETDAGLLSVIGFPAFALDNEEVIGNTRNCIVGMLEGRYGCCRFLRDGYRTAVEDSSRLYYEPWELKQFENIECEWPLFFCYLLLEALFAEDEAKADKYARLLDSLTVKSETGFPLLPESFAVPGDKVASERSHPGSQDRQAVGRCPTCGLSQSMPCAAYLGTGFLRPQELDPIGRRLALEPKPDLVVQVVVIAEDAKIKKTLQSRYGLKQVQDFSEVHSATRIRVFPAKVLGHFYRHLGRCPTLGLSGRPISDVGILATSRLYNVGSRTFLDHHSFYLSLDVNFLLDLFRTDVAYLKSTWSAVGRPLFVIPVYHWYFNPDTAEASQTALLTTIRKLQSGYINGTRVTLGNLADFVDTSCVTQMSFLNSSQSDGLLAKARATAANESALFSRGRCRLGSTASVHSRTFGSSESSPEDQCSVRTRSRRQPPSSAAASAAAAATASRRRKSLVLSNAVSEELGEDLDVTDAGFGLDSFAIHAAAAAAAAATSSFDEDRQHSVDHSSPLAMAYQRLNSVCEGSGLRRTASWRAVIEDCEELCEGKLDNSMTHRLRKPATLEHVDSGENMKRVLRHGQDRDRGHLGVGNGDEGRTLSGHRLSELADKELLRKLEASDQLYEQGLDYDTGWQEAAGPVTVRDLVKELYEKAGSLRQWWLVRFTAGMLDKRVENLPMFLTDLLVTVGLPPEPQHAVINSPLASGVLAARIRAACAGDLTLGVLTQELLVYLSMLARTEPQLFASTCRVRVGLIVRVMGSEMGRALGLNGEDY